MAFHTSPQPPDPLRGTEPQYLLESKPLYTLKSLKNPSIPAIADPWVQRPTYDVWPLPRVKDARYVRALRLCYNEDFLAMKKQFVQKIQSYWDRVQQHLYEKELLWYEDIFSNARAIKRMNCLKQQLQNSWPRIQYAITQAYYPRILKCPFPPLHRALRSGSWVMIIHALAADLYNGYSKLFAADKGFLLHWEYDEDEDEWSPQAEPSVTYYLDWVPEYDQQQQWTKTQAQSEQELEQEAHKIHKEHLDRQNLQQRDLFKRRDIARKNGDGCRRRRLRRKGVGYEQAGEILYQDRNKTRIPKKF